MPAGKRYATVSRFQEDADRWWPEAWSIVLQFETPPVEQGSPSLARAWFLAEQAPVARLQAGRTFDLYEGNKKVAVVEILDEGEIGL